MSGRRFVWYDVKCICDECKRSFNSAKLLSMHKKLVHKDSIGKSKCSHCDQEFTNNREYKRHLKLMHPPIQHLRFR